MRDRLVYLSSVVGLGRVRVTYSRELREYTARLYQSPGGPARGETLEGEYFSDDRADAIGTAQAMLAALAAQGA